MKLEKKDPQLFNWSSWRNGSPAELFLVASFHILTITYGKSVIRKYAIGYCDGETLICRPKTEHKAVMFEKDNEIFWFHLTNREFERIFGVGE